MWEWLKRQFNKIKHFFVNLWRDPVNDPHKDSDHAIEPLNISSLFPDKPDPIHELKKNALNNVECARTLLQRNDLKDYLNYTELCELIYTHRKELDPTFIQKMMKHHHISFSDLAQYSAKNALVLLRSRFVNVFTADELAHIYYKHRHDQDFISALSKPREPNTPYPDANLIPTISYILRKAHKQGIFKSTSRIIQQSATLLFFFSKELNYNSEHKRPEDAHRKPEHAKVQFPEEDPYAVLELNRDASPDEVRKAYREKALVFHPDKMKGDDGSLFRKANEAYKFLRDPEKRKAWDEAHPEGTASKSSKSMRR